MTKPKQTEALERNARELSDIGLVGEHEQAAMQYATARDRRDLLAADMKLSILRDELLDRLAPPF